MQKITLFFSFLITLALSTAVIVFFDEERRNINIEPQELYQVYLAGEKIAVIESKEKLESYIDQKQSELKTKYKVDKIYPPKNLNIQKYISYGEKVMSEEEVYKLINEKSPFTVKGWTFKIISQTEGEKDKIVNVIDDDIFVNASNITIEAFVPKEEYKLYLEEKQPEIKDVGKIIEKIDIPNIKKKENYISVNEPIFTDEKELAKYLLFGTTGEQQKYVVKAGETIDQIAYNNKLGTEEFLIVNPSFKDANSLLTPGQEVSVAVINPIIKVVVEEHIVEDQVIKYNTKTTYDSTMYYGTNVVKQEGADGLERITIKRQTVNGEVHNAFIDVSKTTVLKQAVEKIVVSGTKRVGGDITIVLNGEWVWPTLPYYIITSKYGYRWGSYHEGLDISGTGEGSPIFAANDGVVVNDMGSWTLGKHIVLKHGNNYYTLYAHLSKEYVSIGQIVKKGSIIGAMGHTGRVVGNPGTHLHFGAYLGNEFGPYLDKHFDPYKLYR